MREITIAIPTGATATPPVVLDQYIAPFQVSYTHTGSGTVQVSQTNPYPVVDLEFTAPTFTWITAPTTAPNTATLLAQPFRAIRLVTGAPGDTLTVVQAGIK
jgi:hypothetical protein